MLLVELGGGVDVAGVGRCVLGNSLGGERASAALAWWVESPGAQPSEWARPRPDQAVLGAAVPPLAVDHHAAREDQPAVEPPLVERAQQDRGAKRVVLDVVGRIGEVDAKANHGRLVGDAFDSPRGCGGGAGVADVAP